MRTAGFTKTSEGRNYLPCDGRAVSSNYPRLQALMSHTPNLSDRVAWGAGSYTAGTYLDAGLPNITGTVKGISPNAGYGEIVDISGAFSVRYGVHCYTHQDNREYWDGTYYSFDASHSNPIYGLSTTVRPPSLVVQFYIRAK